MNQKDAAVLSFQCQYLKLDDTGYVEPEAPKIEPTDHPQKQPYVRTHHDEENTPISLVRSSSLHIKKYMKVCACHI